jgi:hypothetical protein
MAISQQGSRAVYTTHISVGYLPRAVVSLRVRHGQLTRLDSHQLDCSTVGCSALPDVISASPSLGAWTLTRVGSYDALARFFP